MRYHETVLMFSSISDNCQSVLPACLAERGFTRSADWSARQFIMSRSLPRQYEIWTQVKTAALSCRSVRGSKSARLVVLRVRTTFTAGLFPGF
jgi:hypothetical protein